MIGDNDCSTEDFGLCSECHDHCEYIEDEPDVTDEQTKHIEEQDTVQRINDEQRQSRTF